ncbi:MAG: hypothetical protein MJ191_03730 [Clostridium sp.]|nr:hypothetical protein [Clostridium sp.]
MTEFFSNFGKKISNVGQETVKKTKEIAEISKISNKIKDEEKKINGLYTELGKKYFSLYSRNKVSEIQDICSSITDSLQVVEEMKKELKLLKGIRICDNCGAEQYSNVVYCSKCGEKLIKDVNDEVVENIESSQEQNEDKEDSVNENE